MKPSPNPQDLQAIRHGAELANIKPYLDVEIQAMQKAIVSNILSNVNAGTLTPEIAMSKWMEYIAYQKLNNKFEQRIQIGQSVGATKNLDN